ncbi:MAG: hypothetical protein IKI64_07960 [Clostridia bacterium]|nr:hypothetical protein [Clostridia bacterium]
MEELISKYSIGKESAHAKKRAGKGPLRRMESSEGTRGIGSRAAKLLRVLTVPPLMALLLVTALYIGLKEEAFATPWRYLEAVFTLCVLPLLAYPLCAAVPSLRALGRKAERNTAIIFSMLGYIMGLLFAIFGNGSRTELELYITYALSGVLLGLFSFVLRFKASGHGCGVSGPFSLLAYKFGWGWLLGLLLLIPVFASSIRLERHKVSELIAGAAISVCSLTAAVLIVRLIMPLS